MHGRRSGAGGCACLHRWRPWGVRGVAGGCTCTGGCAVAPAVAPEAALACSGGGPPRSRSPRPRRSPRSVSSRCAAGGCRLLLGWWSRGLGLLCGRRPPGARSVFSADHAHGLRGDSPGHYRRSAQLAAVPPEAAPVAQVEAVAALAARAEGRQRRRLFAASTAAAFAIACRDRRRRFARQVWRRRLGRGLVAEDRPGPAQPR